jgi:hypothetical protein
MSLRVLALANVIVGLAFGVGLVFAPDFLLGSYGLQTSAVTVLVARLMGAEFLGFNTMTLLVLGQLENPPVGRALIFGRLLSEGSAAIVAWIALVTGMGKVAGQGNTMLWTIPAIYTVFTLGYFYFLVRQSWDSKS